MSREEEGDTKTEGSCSESEMTELQCFPLVSVLLALANEDPESGSRDHSRPIRGPRVNLLSLDIEGAESEVFKTIPWDKVDIEVIVTELVHAGEVSDYFFCTYVLCYVL